MIFENEVSLSKIQSQDCDLLFKWVNDPEVRENAFNTSPISYEEHVKWFKNKIDSKTSFIYIARVGNSPIGQIRIDIEFDQGIIS